LEASIDHTVSITICKKTLTLILRYSDIIVMSSWYCFFLCWNKWFRHNWKLYDQKLSGSHV